MIYAKVKVQVEADDIAAGCNLGCLGLAAVFPRALVTTEVGAVDEVIVMGVEAKVMLANIFVGASADAVEHQVREEEVG
jgi:hypothetical protein